MRYFRFPCTFSPGGVCDAFHNPPRRARFHDTPLRFEHLVDDTYMPASLTNHLRCTVRSSASSSFRDRRHRRVKLEQESPCTRDRRRSVENVATAPRGLQSNPRGARAVSLRCGASANNRGGKTVRDDDLSHVDLYALLGVSEKATTNEIKSAYRALMKACHPDHAMSFSMSTSAFTFISGSESIKASLAAASKAAEAASSTSLSTFDEDEVDSDDFEDAGEITAAAAVARRERDAAEVSQLLNKAWHTLRDPDRRSMYDSGRMLFGATSLFASFTGVPLSKTARPDLPVALFVDEGRCIGCKQCALHAPSTFVMEPNLNVARVETQWGDDEENVEIAVACCPMDCIHTVPREDLAMLEWVHRSQPRQRVVNPQEGSTAGRGKGLEESPFVAMERFNRRRVEMMQDTERARAREEWKQKAAAATEKMNHIVSWARFFHRGDSNEEGERAVDADARAQSCPLPRRHTNEHGQPLLLP